MVYKPSGPQDEEIIEEQLTRIAMITVTLRKLINHVHRSHNKTEGLSWQNCDNEWCLKAHNALEGPAKKRL